MNHRFVTHRVNLFEPDLLFSIHCLAFNLDENKLAVLRRSLPRDLKSKSSSDVESGPILSHSLIELWDCSFDRVLTLGQVIHEDEDDPCLLEALGWSFDNQLWTCGSDGRLHLVDLINSSLNKSYALVSGPGWCLQFDGEKKLVAIGTQEGVCVFDVSAEKNGANLLKTMKQDRVMSLAWYDFREDRKIIAGSTGTIRIWNYEMGNCLSVIRSSHENVLFWCLTIVDGFTIVSGDSKGYTSFWDGKNATLINEMPSHKADVLCLTQSMGKRCFLYSAGTDPKVVTFSIDSRGKGIESQILQLHNHDVRSLVVSKDWLFSGGFDCYLTRACAFPHRQIRQAPVFNNFVHINKKQILFQYSKSLQIWEIGSTTNSVNSNINNHYKDDNNHGYQNDITMGVASQLPLLKGPSQLYNIKTKRLIHQSNFSGPWIAYSILEKVKILYCSNDAVTKIPILYDPFPQIITGIEFIDEKFIILSTGLVVYAFKLDVSGIVHEKTLKYKKRIVRIASSTDYLALSFANLCVSLINTKDWSVVSKFKLGHLPTCLAFNPFQKDSVWFTFSNHLILSYSVLNQGFSKYSFNEPNPNLPMIGLTFHPNGFVAYDQDRLYHYNGTTWTSSDRYSHLAKVEYLPERHEFVVIEVTPSMVKKKLPTRFTKKKFGT